jgi:hypothetical protein
VAVAGCAGEAAPEPAPLGFVDVAAAAGLDVTQGAFHWGPSADPAAMMGGGLCWIDYDDDGWLDLFVVNSYSENEWGLWQEEGGGVPTARLFRNRKGSFSDVTEKAGVGFELRGTGCVAADLDLDGHVDLFVTTERDDKLLWNEGNGEFSDGTALAGVDVFGWHAGAAAGDVNGDGWPDLFVTGYVDPNTPNEDGIGFPDRFRPRRDLLYLNEGAGADGHVTFREVAETVGIEPQGPEYGLGAILSDFDGDGDLDLFVGNESDPNRLYRNDPVESDVSGIGMRFVDVTDAAGVGDTNSAMGVAAEDYDDDGAVDLTVTNHGGQLHSVYHNELGLGFAADGARLAGPTFGLEATGWGLTWADFDLDGDKDLMIANGFIPLFGDEEREPLSYFDNTGSGLVEAASAVGLAAVGPLHGRGLAAADYDNDGDIDVAVSSLSDPLLLLDNTLSGPRWLTVDLEGFHPGATVTAVLDDGTDRRCEVRAGSSFQSSEDPRCHFGLGDARQVMSLTVRWLDGTVLELSDPGYDRLIEVEKP